MSGMCGTVYYPELREKISTADGTLSAARAKELVEHYKIPQDKIPKLERVLCDIIAIYKDCAPPRKIASKQEMGHLRKTLVTARRYLRRSDVLARIADVTGESHKTKEELRATAQGRPQALVLAIDELLPLVTEARAKDGRALAATARSNARGRKAAKKLHDFWIKDLVRGRSVQNRGESPALKFILDCLRDFDPTIKETSIRGFEHLNAARDRKVKTSL